MGYTTNFSGEFTFNRPLSTEETKYIKKFGRTRRLKRTLAGLLERDKGKNGLPFKFKLNSTQEALVKELETSGLHVSIRPIKDNRTALEIYGPEGQFYVGDDEYLNVSENSTPPNDQPGLYCQWVTDGLTLHWDGNEKFYYYVEWLKYLIENFFIPWEVILNGEVTWEGEESSDIGKIVVTDNVVTTKKARITYD